MARAVSPDSDECDQSDIEQNALSLHTDPTVNLAEFGDATVDVAAPVLRRILEIHEKKLLLSTMAEKIG